ncbi:MAG: NrfD/PsrC family molybdoenzyme membrane anchor subunit [Candidatus Geothermarchaeales archaeon]
MGQRFDESLLQPITSTSKWFYAFMAVLLALIMVWGYSYSQQLTQGLGVTGMNRPVYWGIYISTFVFWIGISHAGIAISASVRLLGIKSQRPVTRIAELLTVVALFMAILCIVVDLGRPDRILHLFAWGRYQSILIWDITAVTTYLTGSIIYLYLSMRADFLFYSKKVSRLSWLYNFLALGYRGGEMEEERHEKALWWIAVAIVPIMVTVHTVVSWVFGLQSARPGWFSAIFGIYFVIGAVASGLASIITIAWILRRLFRWERYLNMEVFKGLAWALRNVLILYFYLWIAEEITIRYLGPLPEVSVSNALFFGEFSWVFWPMLVLTFIFPALILFLPLFKKELFNLNVVVLASVLLNVGLWIKRVVIVVPTLTYPRLYPPVVTYTPTLAEWSITLGTFWIAITLYTLFIKLFPIIEGKLGVIIDD